jgi:phage shock protein PspC (stress-responsive transcriptional regulator)
VAEGAAVSEKASSSLLGVCAWAANKWGGDVEFIRIVAFVAILCTGILPGIAVYIAARLLISFFGNNYGE